MKEPYDGRAAERIRSALRAAVPDDIAAAGRADGVVDRDRLLRTWRRVGGVAAVGVAAAALIVGPHFIDASRVSNSAAGPTDSARSTASSGPFAVRPSPYANPCPVSPIPVPETAQARVLLQPDVVSVRLCRASSGGVASAWQPPQEALVNQVGGFAAAIAQLPRGSADYCVAARVGAQPFAFQLTDAAGHTETLSSAITRCGTVTINFHQVSADRVLQLFRQALAHQREVLAVHRPHTKLSCGRGDPPILPTWGVRVTMETRFVAAAVCRGSAVAGPRTFAGSSPVIDQLNKDWATGSKVRVDQAAQDGRCVAVYGSIPSAYLMTTQGDVVRLGVASCKPAHQAGNFPAYQAGDIEFGPSKELSDALGMP